MFAKLFSSITESSLWSEPKEVRLLFVSMLARADQVGFVEASIPGLARLANLTIAETESALKVLQSPDKYSKNPDNEGRRVAEVDGGFLLLNYETYRARRNQEERREYMREYMRERRKQPVNNVNNCKHDVNNVSHGKPPLAQAEAEAEAEKNHSLSAKSGRKYDPEFENFWKAFPSVRRTKKADAYKKWKIATKDHDAKWLTARADEYARSPRGRSEYAVMPSVWLNSGMYDDEPDAWGQSAKPESRVFTDYENYSATGGNYT